MRRSPSLDMTVTSTNQAAVDDHVAFDTFDNLLGSTLNRVINLDMSDIECFRQACQSRMVASGPTSCLSCNSCLCGTCSGHRSPPGGYLGSTYFPARPFGTHSGSCGCHCSINHLPPSMSHTNRPPGKDRVLGDFALSRFWPIKPSVLIRNVPNLYTYTQEKTACYKFYRNPARESPLRGDKVCKFRDFCVFFVLEPPNMDLSNCTIICGTIRPWRVKTLKIAI